MFFTPTPPVLTGSGWSSIKKKAHPAAGIDSAEGSSDKFLKLCYLPHGIHMLYPWISLWSMKFLSNVCITTSRIIKIQNQDSVYQVDNTVHMPTKCYRIWLAYSVLFLKFVCNLSHIESQSQVCECYWLPVNWLQWALFIWLNFSALIELIICIAFLMWIREITLSDALRYQIQVQRKLQEQIEVK